MSVQAHAPHPRRIPGVVAAATGLTIILVAAGVFVAYGPARTAPDGSLRPAAADCSVLNSNASLNGTVAEIYHGLANVSHGWSPAGNTTEPANASAYPSEYGADEELAHAWTEICRSAAYASLEEQWGAGNVSGGLAINGSTGHYQVNFGVYWHAACTIAADNADGYCQYSTTWYVDLANGDIDGPVTAEWGGPPPGWGPPPAFPVGLSNGSVTTRGPAYWYNYTIAYVDAGVTFGALGIEVKTFDCANVSNVLSIQFVSPSGPSIASENLASKSWGAAASTPVSGNDDLSVESQGSLSGDEMILESGTGETSFQIVASASAWEGCEF